MKKFIIIPAYNESDKIREVIKEVKKQSKNIIIVDDGSKDETALEAEQEGVIVLRHHVNLGKGVALKTGCDYALKLGAEELVVMDSDGQHLPKDIPKFLQNLKGKDIVFGYRKLNPKMPSILKFGNSFINNTLSLLFGIRIKDSQSGFRAFTKEAYQKIRWNATDYYIETEMIIKAGRHKLKYTQIPIETIYTDRYKGTTVIDGVKIVLKMIGMRLIK